MLGSVQLMLSVFSSGWQMVSCIESEREGGSGVALAEARSNTTLTPNCMYSNRFKDTDHFLKSLYPFSSAGPCPTHFHSHSKPSISLCRIESRHPFTLLSHACLLPTAAPHPIPVALVLTELGFLEHQEQRDCVMNFSRR